VKASSAPATGVNPGGNVLAAAAPPNANGNAKATQIYNAGPTNVSLGAGSGVTVPGTTGGGTGTTLPAGGGVAHQNMQPFLGLRCIIALQGIFPPRN
jgi:microcystin-dependent protein